VSSYTIHGSWDEASQVSTSCLSFYLFLPLFLSLSLSLSFVLCKPAPANPNPSTLNPILQIRNLKPSTFNPLQ
jgi:hypothetical protein